MVQLFIVVILLTELFLARAFTREKATLIFGVISGALCTLFVVLYLEFIHTIGHEWEGAGLLLGLYVVYIMAAVNSLAGLINGVVAFRSQHLNRNRIRVGLALNGIVFILILFNEIRRRLF